MNRDGIADPPYLDAPEPPERGEAHVWRVELPATGGRDAARRALREILAAYLGQAPDAVELTIGESGKPGLASGDRGAPGAEGGGRGGTTPAAVAPPISFNLSHSGGLALIAVAAGGTEVGIDVERLRPRRDLARLAARRLPAEDAEAVASADEGAREELFYAAWTRHEARAKCSGAGLSGPPPRPEIVAQELVIDPGYAAAIAFDLGATGGMPRITLRQA